MKVSEKNLIKTIACEAWCPCTLESYRIVQYFDMLTWLESESPLTICVIYLSFHESSVSYFLFFRKNKFSLKEEIRIRNGNIQINQIVLILLFITSNSCRFIYTRFNETEFHAYTCTKQTFLKRTETTNCISQYYKFNILIEKLHALCLFQLVGNLKEVVFNSYPKSQSKRNEDNTNNFG